MRCVKYKTNIYLNKINYLLAGYRSLDVDMFLQARHCCVTVAPSLRHASDDMRVNAMAMVNAVAKMIVKCMVNIRMTAMVKMTVVVKL